MNIEEAIQKAKRVIGENDIEYAIKCGGGYVFFAFNILQPVYVSGNIIRGMNGNSEEDRTILDYAEKQRKKGNFI